MRDEAVKELDRACALELALQEELATRGTRGEMIRELVAEVDALKASRGVVSWCSTEIKDLTTTLGALAVAVSHNQREDTPAIEQLRKHLDAIPELASTRKLRHEERRTIAQAAISTFEQLGFIVSERRPERADGDWVIEAKHEQGSVAMALPATGDARVTSTAISDQRERGAQPGCTDVLRLLDQLREGMRERHIELGDARWEQEDPGDPESAEHSQPSSARRDGEVRMRRGSNTSTRKVP